MLLNKKIIILVIFITTTLTLGFLYTNNIYDIGFSTKKFATRDFNLIFNLRTSGNCDEFGKFITQEYAKDWFERCLEEKERNKKYPIKSFTVTSTSTTQNKAFVQAELERYNNVKGEYLKYPTNYELKKESRKWFLFIPKTQFIINQSID